MESGATLPPSIEQQIAALRDMLTVHDQEDTRRFDQLMRQAGANAVSSTRKVTVRLAWQEVTAFVRMVLIIGALWLGQGHTPGDLVKAIMELMQ